MPLKRVELRHNLLKVFNKAMKEAQEAGIKNPLQKVKKALDANLKYKVWKDKNTK